MDATATITTHERISRTGYLVAITMFIFLIIDGCDIQMLAVALPNIMQELNLNPVMGGFLATCSFFGMLVGGILAGWISDRLGRVKVVAWGIVLFSVATGLIALTQNFWQFAILRFLTGFGVSAFSSVGLVMAAEYVPTKQRNTVLGVLHAASSVGYVIAAILASYLIPNYGWRLMFIIAIFPACLGILLSRFLKEPPSYVAAQEQRKTDKKIANEFAIIYRDKTLLKYFFVWTISSFFLQAGFYAANTWLPTYLVKELGVDLKSMGWFIAGNYTMVVLGKVVAGFLSDKFGRKMVWVVASILTAVAFPLITHYITATNVGYLMLIFGIFYGAPLAISFTFISESFPTKVRGTATGGVWNAGRLGSMVSPLVVGYMATQYSIGYGIALMGAAYAITGISTGLFIKEKLYDPKAVDNVTMSNASLISK